MRWAAADPKDIGLQTEQVLAGGDTWDVAAARHFQVNGRAAGNGSLMRTRAPARVGAAPCWSVPRPTRRVGNRPAGARGSPCSSGTTAHNGARVGAAPAERPPTTGVAALTGTLAGSVYGPGAVPARWTSLLHVPLPGSAGRVLRAEDLRDLARALASGP
ncbi:hypothetical protein [Streptomyces sp. NK15101]|uniref:hypothetical protein n=1 Tax=Streptomyces sp. NK15101 TaxID=2873261 RepID=UPI001CEDF497|nr:hypothetical protein [Streptomyces sp. NK15101]